MKICFQNIWELMPFDHAREPFSILAIDQSAFKAKIQSAAGQSWIVGLDEIWPNCCCWFFSMHSRVSVARRDLHLWVTLVRASRPFWQWPNQCGDTQYFMVYSQARHVPFKLLAFNENLHSDSFRVWEMLQDRSSTHASTTKEFVVIFFSYVAVQEPFKLEFWLVSLK
jgi:hypothetical protein